MECSKAVLRALKPFSSKWIFFLMQFEFVIFTLDIEGYDVSNVEKYLVRVLYRDNAECVDVQ